MIERARIVWLVLGAFLLLLGSGGVMGSAARQLEAGGWLRLAIVMVIGFGLAAIGGLHLAIGVLGRDASGRWGRLALPTAAIGAVVATLLLWVSGPLGVLLLIGYAYLLVRPSTLTELGALRRRILG